MSEKYTREYFVEKFSKLSDEDVGDSQLDNKCALFHCGVTDAPDGYVMTDEANALAALFTPLFNRRMEPHKAIYHINDGIGSKYPQPTPRLRILAALEDVKGKESK